MKELFERLKTGKIQIIFYEKTDNIFVQLFRYVFVGGLAFLVDSGSMLLMVRLGMNEYVAVAIAFLLGLIANYILSKVFVFQEQSAKTNAVGEFVAYAVIGVIGLGLTELLMALMLEVIGLPILLAKIIAAAIVLLWNFIARKIVLYR